MNTKGFVGKPVEHRKLARDRGRRKKCKADFRYWLCQWEPPVQRQLRIRTFRLLWVVSLEQTRLNYRILQSGYFMY